MYNRGDFFFEHSLKKAAALGVDCLQLFFWHCSDGHIQKVKEAGLSYAICSFGLTRRRYEKLATKKDPVFVYYDDLRGIKK